MEQGYSATPSVLIGIQQVFDRYCNQRQIRDAATREDIAARLMNRFACGAKTEEELLDGLPK